MSSLHQLSISLTVGRGIWCLCPSRGSKRSQAGRETLTGNLPQAIHSRTTLKSQVVSLQTAHSWANAGVLLGDACIGSGVAFEAIKLLG